MNRLQHHFNSQHVYCRLRNLGLGKPMSQRFAALWERVSRFVLYRRR